MLVDHRDRKMEGSQIPNADVNSVTVAAFAAKFRAMKAFEAVGRSFQEWMDSFPPDQRDAKLMEHYAEQGDVLEEKFEDAAQASAAVRELQSTTLQAAVGSVSEVAAPATKAEKMVEETPG